MLPGEEKVFTFSFRSVKPGVFNEEWELITDPPLNDALPVVQISAHSLEDETDLDDLANFDLQIEQAVNKRQFEEIFDDLIERVKTPIPPLPDMNDPSVFKHMFELQN